MAHLFRFERAEQIDKIIAASWTSPDLAQQFSGLLTPVALTSPEADEARKHYRQYLDLEKRAKERHEPPLLSPPPKERIEHWLAQCESDNPDAWWILNREMQLEPTSTRYDNDIEPDLTVLPGWKSADDRTQGIDIGKQRLNCVVRAWRRDGTGFTIEYDTVATSGTAYGSDEGVDEAIERALHERKEFVDRGAVVVWDWAQR